MPFPVGIRMYLFISVSMPPLPADEICCDVVTIPSYHLTTRGQLGPTQWQAFMFLLRRL